MLAFPSLCGSTAAFGCSATWLPGTLWAWRRKVLKIWRAFWPARDQDWKTCCFCWIQPTYYLHFSIALCFDHSPFQEPEANLTLRFPLLDSLDLSHVCCWVCQVSSGRRKRSVVLLPKSKDGSKSESSLPNVKAEDGMELNSERLGANVTKSAVRHWGSSHQFTILKTCR